MPAYLTNSGSEPVRSGPARGAPPLRSEGVLRRTPSERSGAPGVSAHEGTAARRPRHDGQEDEKQCRTGESEEHDSLLLRGRRRARSMPSRRARTGKVQAAEGTWPRPRADEVGVV